MAITSSFRKLSKQILLEYVYDTNNVILEPYNIISNAKTLMNSYIANNSTITNNEQLNQLFLVNAVQNSYTQVNTSQYSFLSINNYVPQNGIQHDRIRIYLPTNFTFGEYQGFYLRVYTYDYNNKNFYELSNFFFNINNETTSDLLETASPPLLYQGVLWNTYIEVDVPSVYQVALQNQNGSAIIDTINYNLTDGVGLSQTAPIFIDFRFIALIQELGNITNYLTTNPLTTQIPQIPDLETLQVVIDESDDGDYFEIYSIYNGTFEQFVSFLENSILIGQTYLVQYIVTIFEQNIEGISTTFQIDSNDYSEITLYRPILKYSSSIVVIDVQMQLINQVNGSIITRNAAYGLTSDQISKYGLYFSKVQVDNVNTTTIYNQNEISISSIFTLQKYPQLEATIQVPFPILINTVNICAYSKQAINTISQTQIDNYHPFGEMEIEIKPFDNILRFVIANKITNSGATGSNTTFKSIDLSSCQNLQLLFQNDTSSIPFNQYIDNQTSAKNGMCNFKIDQNSFIDISNIYASGTNVFYITTTNQNFQTLIYTGLFKVSSLMEQAPASNSSPQLNKLIINDPNASSIQSGIAIVTRQAIPLVGTASTISLTQSLLANMSITTQADKYNLSNLGIGTFSNSSTPTNTSNNSTTTTLFNLIVYAKLNTTGSPASIGGTITKSPNTTQSANNKFTLTAVNQVVNNQTYTFNSWYINLGQTPTGFSSTSTTINITLLSNTTIYCYFVASGSTNATAPNTVNTKSGPVKSV